jgi:septal ring factor EnvC (AmiA/AmiB activator)
MKWKDSGDMMDKKEDTKEEFFDEEEYSPWADAKDDKKGLRLGKIPILFILLAGAIVALVAALLMLIFNGNGDTANTQKIAALQERLQRYEERLEKYDAIDEKVTRIWEQAKSFEKFKARFDRSEASMSLRMDHLTMGLEALQKQITEARTQKAAEVAEKPVKDQKPTAAAVIKYHQVRPGDTLYSISKKYALKVEELLAMNRMKAGSVIVPGQKLIVRSADNQ